MKKKLNIKTIQNIIPLLGLVLLLLISPCKIRNFVEAKLGFPTTQVINKSKTTITISCNNAVLPQSKLIKFNTCFKYLPLVFVGFKKVPKITDASNLSTQFREARNYSATTIPLYILYQKFTNYL
ncbi:hypothetical protein [Tenacibaculum piscium]|uniref:hypothetical protein n=1 Tax=Tenacibaculum piscium TaxID=1458515 RepID=UPI001F421E7D|nr:hypothetical protein [Tenacibaculum piscium]MCG8183478.1 hypothetical protein [Tenacibaculum piscium]MCG8205035.1 hypothetical protein [Tenacibaculum piscium]